MPFTDACRIVARWMIENDPKQDLDLSCLELTELPVLPVNVVRINISYNRLTKFPDLPTSVRHVRCRYNQIRELECVPVHINYLDISDNFLAYTPYCLSEQTVLLASNNPLLIRDVTPAHTGYIMDMRYSESLVRTLLHGL
jgi:hypothetical protein